jgi:hypothetical protein
MRRSAVAISVIFALLVVSGRALAWNASFQRAAQANGSFSSFGTLLDKDMKNLTVKMRVDRAETARQELFGYSVTFHCAPTLEFSRCSTKKSVAKCLDGKQRKLKNGDALAQIKKGDRLIFSGRYDPRNKELILSELVVWLHNDPSHD